MQAENFDFAAERMTRQQAAHYLGVSVQFLTTDVVHRRHGIPYLKLGRKVFYRKSDLDQWIERCVVSSTPPGGGSVPQDSSGI